MFWILLILIVSSALLIWSSKILITQSQLLAALLGLSTIFISLTVVALGTSLPELVVAAIALWENDANLASGQIMGSNITNSTMIFGIAVMLSSIKLRKARMKTNALLLVLITSVYIFATFGAFTQTTAGALLIGAGIGITLFGYFEAVGGHEHEEQVLMDELEHLTKKRSESLHRIILKLVAAILIMGASGQLLVINAQLLAVRLELSTTILGLTLISLLTSMPELVTTIVASRHRESNMAIGNILGSNIYNLAMIGGFVALSGSSTNINIMEMAFLAISTGLLVVGVRLWHGRVIPSGYGVIGIFVYILFVMSTYLGR